MTPGKGTDGRRNLSPNAEEHVRAIVEAAERAAESIVDDAEAQAERYLVAARAEADRAAGERLELLSGQIDSLLEQAEALKRSAERLAAALGRSADSAAAGERAAELPERAPYLAAVPAPAPNGEASARLLATQMAVSGSSREEIAEKLRNGFEIEDTDAILDAILGHED